MAQDASAIRVALQGHIWVADEGTTIPDNAEAAPGAGFTDLGYTTEDGVTFNISKDITDLMGWQSIEILRSIVTSEPKTISFTLRQLQRETLLSTLNGTITETGTGTGLYRWTPDAGSLPVKILLVDFVDGDIVYRFGFRRAQQVGEAEITFSRSDSINLPNEWKGLAASPESWFIDSNDPAWAAV